LDATKLGNRAAGQALRDEDLAARACSRARGNGRDDRRTVRRRKAAWAVVRDERASQVGGRPAPAQLAKKAADAVGPGTRVTKDDAPRLTNTMHWTYGTTLGVLYAVAARALRPQPLLGGVGFGLGVWSASYAQLVPLGIYDPPWRYPCRRGRARSRLPRPLRGDGRGGFRRRRSSLVWPP